MQLSDVKSVKLNHFLLLLKIASFSQVLSHFFCAKSNSYKRDEKLLEMYGGPEEQITQTNRSTQKQ